MRFFFFFFLSDSCFVMYRRMCSALFFFFSFHSLTCTLYCNSRFIFLFKLCHLHIPLLHSTTTSLFYIACVAFCLLFLSISPLSLYACVIVSSVATVPFCTRCSCRIGIRVPELWFLYVHNILGRVIDRVGY